jgi:hypothetical protein
MEWCFIFTLRTAVFFDFIEHFLVILHVVVEGKQGSTLELLGDRKAALGIKEVPDIPNRLMIMLIQTLQVSLRNYPARKSGAYSIAKFRYITDFDAKSLWRKMSRAYEPDKVKLSDVQNVIQPDYLAELARTVTVKGGDREQKLFEEYLKKWMVAMVAAWVEPDVVNTKFATILLIQ